MNFNLDNRILLAGSFVAAISMLPFNEGFYIFTRVVVCLTGVYAVFLLNKKNNAFWIPSALIAILYNPFFPVYLHEKELWVSINLITFLFFFWIFYQEERSRLLTSVIYYLIKTATVAPILFVFVLGMGLGLTGEYEQLEDFESKFLMLVFGAVLGGLFYGLFFNFIFFKKKSPWLEESPSEIFDEVKKQGKVN